MISKTTIPNNIYPYFLAGKKLYEAKQLAELANQQGSPPLAIINYIGLLSGVFPPSLIKEVFPEGYLFKEYFFWIKFPLKNSYVFKYKDEYFGIYAIVGKVKFTTRSNDYKKLLIKFFHYLAALYLKKTTTKLKTLQIVPTNACNDSCSNCPFVFEPKLSKSLSIENTIKIIELINTNKEIKELIFVGRGEPFLNFPAILKIAQESKYVKKIGIYTNGFWGSNALSYLTAISRSNPDTIITINLSVDIYHSAHHLISAKQIISTFIMLINEEQTANLKIILRGLIPDKDILPHDPLALILEDYFPNKKKLQQVHSRLKKGEKVTLPETKNRLIVGYNFLKKALPSNKIPENYNIWHPTLNITERGLLSIGSYDQAAMIEEMDYCEDYRSVYLAALNNILLHVLDSEHLIKAIKSLRKTFPFLDKRIFITTDIFRNIYKYPNIALTFIFKLYQYAGNTHSIFRQILNELGIKNSDTITTIKKKARILYKPSEFIPSAKTRKKNWWFKTDPSTHNITGQLNPWLQFWAQEEQQLAQQIYAKFQIDKFFKPISNFLQCKYQLTLAIKDITCICVVGSTTYSLSKAYESTDVDYIFVIKPPAITDNLNICQTKDNIWLISEEYFKNNTTSALHIDLANNISHGLVLYGENPVAVPIPIIEKIKMAYFYANLIQRIIFDKRYHDVFKRYIELNRILFQVQNCLKANASTEILNKVDFNNYHLIKKLFFSSIADIEFDCLKEWNRFDAIVAQNNPEVEKKELLLLFAKACYLRKALAEFILKLDQIIYTKNRLYQKSRHHVYAVFNARKSNVPFEWHQEYLHAHNRDFTIITTLAETSPYPAILMQIKDILDTKSYFTNKQISTINFALAKNINFQEISISSHKDVFIFDSNNGGHHDEVRMVDFSSKAPLMVSAGYDHGVRLINYIIRNLEYVFDNTNGGHRDIVQSAKFSPDGNLVATASRDNSVKIFEVATKRVVFSFEGTQESHKDWAMHAEVSKDNRLLLTSGWDKKAILIDLLTQEVIHTFYHPDHVRVASFNPSNNNIIVTACDDGIIRIYNLKGRKLIWELSKINSGHTEAVLFTKFDATGSIIASTSDDHNVLITNWLKKNVIYKFTKDNGGFIDNVRAATFSSNGRLLVTAGRDKTVRIVDLLTKKVLFILGPHNGGHSNGVNSVAISPNNQWLASAGADSTIRLIKLSCT